MHKILSCGQYSIPLQAQDMGMLMKAYPKLTRYLMSSNENQTELSLMMIDGMVNKCVDHSEGWDVRYSDGFYDAVYLRENQSAFELQYGRASKNITVRFMTGSMIDLWHGLQYGMMLALHQHCVGLHGVTLLCGNELVILSAPSGTGKTTLSHLLEEYCDAIVINGDFALLSVSDEGIIFEPTPFCGSSGRCLNQRVRVDRVVFLSQSKDNRWLELDGRQALTHFMTNAFVPEWDDGVRQAIQENIMRCVSCLKVDAFSFAPDREAAEMFCDCLRS